MASSFRLWGNHATSTSVNQLLSEMWRLYLITARSCCGVIPLHAFFCCVFLRLSNPLLFNVAVNKYSSLIRVNKIKKYKLWPLCRCQSKYFSLVKNLWNRWNTSEGWVHVEVGWYIKVELYRLDWNLSTSSYCKKLTKNEVRCDLHNPGMCSKTEPGLLWVCWLLYALETSVLSPWEASQHHWHEESQGGCCHQCQLGKQTASDILLIMWEELRALVKHVEVMLDQTGVRTAYLTEIKCSFKMANWENNI